MQIGPGDHISRLITVTIFLIFHDFYHVSKDFDHVFSLPHLLSQILPHPYPPSFMFFFYLKDKQNKILKKHVYIYMHTCMHMQAHTYTTAGRPFCIG